MDDVLAATYRRGRSLKARRRASRALPLVATVLVVAVTMAGSTSSAPRHTKLAIPVVAGDPPPVTAPTSLPVELPLTTSTVPPTTVPKSVPPAVVPTLPTTPPPPTACEAADLVLTAATNSDTYEAGDWVIITGTAENVGAQACYDPTVSGWYLLNQQGNPVVVSYASDNRRLSLLQPGESRSFETHWDTRICWEDTCGPMTRGTYRLRMHWSDGTTATSAPLTID